MVHAWTNGSHGSGSGMTRTSFFVVFVGNCYGFGICSPYAKPGVDQCCSGEEFSQQFVAFEQSSSQSHTRSIHSLTRKQKELFMAYQTEIRDYVIVILL